MDSIYRAGLAIVSLFFAATFFAYAEQPPPPLKNGVFSPAADCGACHREILDKWKDSMHGQSVTDPIFQAAYAQSFLLSDGKSKKICPECHAPTTNVTGDLAMDKDISKEGITCHFCHSITEVHPNGKPRFKLSVGKSLRTPLNVGTTDYHTNILSPYMQKSEFCAGCHEYESNNVKIMSTYSEWKNGPYAAKGIGCQICHMPIEAAVDDKGKPRKVFSHSLAGGHSMAQLRKAVTVNISNMAAQSDRVTVEIEVENHGSGHYVPTGIPTRKLVLYCSIRTSDGKSQKKSVVYEKILFDKAGRELTKDSEIMLGLGAQVVKDNRLAPGERRKESIVFYTPSAGEVAVSAWVDYLYQPLLMQPAEMRMEMTRTDKTFSR